MWPHRDTCVDHHVAPNCVVACTKASVEACRTVDDGEQGVVRLRSRESAWKEEAVVRTTAG